jgi:hypothetical protein
MPIFAAAIVGGSSIVGGLFGASAAKSAAKTQAAAAREATALQKEQFERVQQNLAPYQQSGVPAINALQQGLGLAPGSTGNITQGSLNTPFSQQQFQESPGYQFQLEQGLQASQAAASRTGGLGGNQLLELTRMGQGYASQDYNQQRQLYDQEQAQKYNQLMGLVGVGENAAAGVGTAGQTYATAAGSNIMAGANATSAGQIMGGNFLGGNIAGMGQAIGNQMYTNNLMNPGATNPGLTSAFANFGSSMPTFNPTAGQNLSNFPWSPGG